MEDQNQINGLTELDDPELMMVFLNSSSKACIHYSRRWDGYTREQLPMMLRPLLRLMDTKAHFLFRGTILANT